VEGCVGLSVLQSSHPGGGGGEAMDAGRPIPPPLRPVESEDDPIDLNSHLCRLTGLFIRTLFLISDAQHFVFLESHIVVSKVLPLCEQPTEEIHKICIKV